MNKVQFLALASAVAVLPIAVIELMPVEDTGKALAVSVRPDVSKEIEMKLITFTGSEQEVKIPPALQKPIKNYADVEHFSPEDLKGLLMEAGFSGKRLQTAWAVAMKESTGNARAHNDNSSTGDNSYGLFQINMKGSMGPARLKAFDLNSYEDLFDPQTNARVAFIMSKEGADFGPWGIGPNAYNGGTAGSFHKWLAEYPTN
jgi:hypothetical protein